MVEIIKTNEYNEIFIPESISEVINFNEKLTKIQETFAYEISKKFNIDYYNIINIIPKTIIKYKPDEPKIKIKPKKISINEWTKITNKEDLKNFKLVDLKKILIDNNFKTKGKKNDLIDKIWNILHPEIPLKINNNNNKLLSILSEGDKINIDNIKYTLIKDKNWLFLENAEIFEYIGILKNNKIIKCNAPNELTKMI